MPLVIPNNMARYCSYNFNENDATKVYDWSGNERHSTAVNALSIIAGEIGYACDFNGTTAYANFGNIADFGGTDDITIHLKFKKDTSTKGFIIFKNNHFKISTDLANTITFSLYIAGAWVNLSSVSTFTNGTWYKVVCKYDGTDMKIFVNGTQDATAAQGGNLTASSSNCYLGYDGSTNYFDGKLENVEIYNTALSTDNITALNNWPSGWLITTYKTHEFLTGDLVCTRIDTDGESQGVVTWKVDDNNFYLLPTLNQQYLGEFLMQVGNIFNTARQQYCALNTEAQPELFFSNLVDTHTKRKSTAVRKVRINKDGIVLTTPLGVASGGTGLSSYTIGDLIYASGTTTLSKLADVAVGSILVSGGVGVAPSWSASPTITTSITCPLHIGGTGSGNNLTLQSTSHATKGNFGLDVTPTAKFHIGAIAGANGGILLDLLANSGTPSISYATIDFKVPTTGLLGQFLLTASNYSSASVDVAANSVVLSSLATSGQLSLIAGGSSGYFTLHVGGYAAANRKLTHTTTGLGLGVTSPTAVLHLKAGTATANTAPLKFTSGTLLTAAEAGAIEFLTDKFYGTIITGAARKEFTLNDIALTSGRVPFVTTNGRLTDVSTFVFDGTNMGIGTATPLGKLHLEGTPVWIIIDESDTDPTTTELDADDSVAIYRKNNKIVFAYNFGGTMYYLRTDLNDNPTVTWIRNTTAP